MQIPRRTDPRPQRAPTFLQAATIGTPLVTVAAIQSAVGASLMSPQVVSGAALICALVLLFLGMFFPAWPQARPTGLQAWFAPRGPLALLGGVALLSVALTLLFFFA